MNAKIEAVFEIRLGAVAVVLEKSLQKEANRRLLTPGAANQANLHLVDFDRSHRLSHRLKGGSIHTRALKMALGILLQELDS
jgi:hypothetical protein